jgi:hypothetical protein
MEHMLTLSQIIERELGGIVVDVRDITSGYAGYVYVVRAVVGECPRTACCKW